MIALAAAGLGLVLGFLLGRYVRWRDERPLVPPTP